MVGIGASAGGLTAVRRLLRDVPEDSGLAFVVVMHLAPERESHLAEILQKSCRLSVEQVTESVRIEPNRVYVIPPNANLDSVDTHLRLSPLEEARADRAPIDHFLCTLAGSREGDGIAVILTGTGQDGARGIREVKAHHGLVIAQDPQEAEYDGMPRAALATGVVDLVLSLDQITAALLRFSRSAPRVELPQDDEQPAASQRALLGEVFDLVRERTGRDFSRYKPSTVLRRIVRRMQVRLVEELAEYLELLRRDPEEARTLADDVLIPVTSFFRDREVFEHLEAEVIPRLFEGRGAEDELRVWSTGCATGEEAYSLAMLLLEAAATRRPRPRLQVFASDLHEDSLARAREGLFLGEIEQDLSPQRLRRWFTREEGGYRVRRELREAVVFASHNLLADPPFSRIDLVVCRNLLIYLQRDLQREVVGLFHYALQPGGFLLLGSSETLQGSDRFQLQDEGRCLYQRRDTPVREPRLPVFPLTRGGPTVARRPVRAGTSPLAYGLLHRQFVEGHALPSMLLDPDDRIVHLSETAGRYLRHPGGAVTASTFKLLPEELALELRSLLLAVRESGRSASSCPVELQVGGEAVTVVMRAQPAQGPQQSGFVLVDFEESGRSGTRGRDAESGAAPASGEADEALDRMRGLEADRNRAHMRLQAVVEAYEASQEEMCASNEELQSTNEELRSTLEELETSKEELQSMNQELQTVNQEKRLQVEELAQLGSDLQNLLKATDIATVFLDRDLQIQRFTPKVAELFNVRATDRGRPLSDLTHRLGHPTLGADAEEVLRTLVPIEREVSDAGGRWYLTRVLPYRSSDDRIEGVVITFVEISERKQVEEALRESEERLRLALDAGGAGLWRFDVEAGHVRLDDIARRILEAQAETPTPRDLLERVHPEDRERVLELARLPPSEGELVRPLVEDHRLVRADGSLCWVHVRGQVLYAAGENGLRPVYALGVVLDLTERKRVEEALRQKSAELEATDQRRELFLATLGHELRNPLAALDGALRVMALGVRSSDELQSMMSSHLQQLARLVDELLDLSRVRRGKVTLHRRPVDLSNAVQRGLEMVEEALREKRQELRPELQDGLVVDGDEARLEQIASNLLSNAVRYSPPGSRLHVRAAREGDELVLTVRDEGRGIDADQIEAIFEPFAQADPGSGGLGLGLPLARSLAELHGGSLRAQSPGAGEGSTFTLRLPARPGPEPTRDEPRESSARTALHARILVVDDLRDAADMLALLLRSRGAQTACAYCGQEALERARSWRPDIVLLDLGLPDVDGYEVARRIRQSDGGEEVLLVAVTGMGDPRAARQVQLAGFDARLLKPVDHAALERLLVEHMRRR